MLNDIAWTPAQRDAIYARDGALLLSAAAGSGKTAVLVERLVRLLTDPDDPVDPGSLLVVTFTRPAAAQMRQKLEKRLRKMLEADPADRVLHNALMRLPDAQISTIDAFCGRLVRENFRRAGIVPDYQILDDGRANAFRADAMRQTLEELGRDRPAVYDLLCAMTDCKKNDEPLVDTILQLYQKSVIRPFPDRWLDGVARRYDPDTPIERTAWGAILIGHGKRCVDFALRQLDDCLALADGSEGLYDYFGEKLEDAKAQFEALKRTIETSVWDSIVEETQAISLQKLGRVSKALTNDPNKTLCADKYNETVRDPKKGVVKTLKKLFSITNAMHREDTEALRPVATALVDAVRAFGRTLAELKEQAGAYDYDDILHKAIDLLIAPDGARTPVAEQLSREYRAILVDEYQDTNEAQDLLFRTISGDGRNLFMVGDVKQSIYRFRDAMPEIFTEKYNRYFPFDGTRYPAKILLSTNFRSRRGVLENINRVFSCVMSEYAGGLDYTDDDALHYSGIYDKEGLPPDEDCFELLVGPGEAEAAAQRVRAMLDAGTPVADGGGTRPCRPGDFCVLLRSLKSGDKDNSAPFVRAFASRGIPCAAERSEDLLQSAEIRVFLSLLRAVSNPRDDVSLLAVLFSPLYGCTPDDAARWKQGRRHEKLIRCLRLAAEGGDALAARFLADLDAYRAMNAAMDLGRFTRELLETSGYGGIVGAMPDGPARRQNLLRFCQVASSYAENSDGTADAFLRYIERAEESGSPLKTSVSAGQEDAVRICTIHKSKGLEFPFVLLGGINKAFNTTDLSKTLLIHGEAGVGMKRIEAGRLKKYHTAASLAARAACGRDAVSEEMRTLYVALTRAKEKLIVLAEEKLFANSVTKAVALAGLNGKAHPVAALEAGCPAVWLALGLLPAGAFRRAFEVPLPLPEEGDRFPAPVVRFAETAETGEEEAPEPPAAQPDDALIGAIRERAEYVYPYVYPEGLRPKSVASDFEKRESTGRVYAGRAPAFLSPDGMTAAGRGTANHTFLERWDLRSDPHRTLEALTQSGVLSPAQAFCVRLDKAVAFARSGLGQRVLKAETVFRERDFAVNLTVGQVSPDCAENVRDDRITVVGKADLVFLEPDGAVVVDYKTDRGKTAEDFIRVYAGQLRAYRHAMEIVLGLPVKQAYIYALETETAIEMP